MQGTIHTAAHKFKQMVRDLEIAHTLRPAQPEVLAAIEQQLHLPSDMVEWYTVTDPGNMEVPSFGNRPILFCVQELPEAQVGYRGVSWDSSWIVFGGEGRYPLIARTAVTHDSSIYYGEVQKQSWHITLLSDNLGDFLLGLASYMHLYVADYNGSIQDDDGVLLTTFWHDFAALLDQYPGTADRTQAWLQGWLGY